MEKYGLQNKIQHRKNEREREQDKQSSGWIELEMNNIRIRIRSLLNQLENKIDLHVVFYF